MSDSCGGVSLRTPARESVFLHLPGLVYPKETEFMNHLRNMEQSEQEEQQIALIPSSIQELEDMLELCCHKRPSLPHQVPGRAALRASPITASLFTVSTCSVD